MQSLKEMEFEFWEKFSRGELDSDDEAGCDNSTIRKGSFPKQKQTSHRENLSVTICQDCSMIVKTQAYKAHVKRRHNFGPMSDCACNITVDFPKDETETEEAPIKQATKRRKTDNGLSHMSTNVQKVNHSMTRLGVKDCLLSQNSFKEEQALAKISLTEMKNEQAKFFKANQENVLSPSGFMRPRPVIHANRNFKAQNQSDVSSCESQLQQTFIAPKQNEAHQNLSSQQIKTETPIRLKMKLKKSDLGSWNIVKV